MMRYLRGACNMHPRLAIRVAAAAVIPQDGHGDGTVGILDVLTLLANWGAVPLKKASGHQGIDASATSRRVNLDSCLRCVARGRRACEGK